MRSKLSVLGLFCLGFVTFSNYSFAENFQFPADYNSCVAKLYDMQINNLQMKNEIDEFKENVITTNSNLNTCTNESKECTANLKVSATLNETYQAEAKEISAHSTNIYRTLSKAAKKQPAVRRVSNSVLQELDAIFELVK